MLMLHILIAAGSFIATAGSFISYQRFHVAAWLLFAATLISGAGLMMLDHGLIAQVCTNASVYSAIALTGMALARRRFARVLTSHN